MKTITQYIVKVTTTYARGEESTIRVEEHKCDSKPEQEWVLEREGRFAGVKDHDGIRTEVVVEASEEQIEPKFFSEHMYSDVKAYEVIRVVSDNTIEVRPMDTKFSFKDCDVQAGGFAFHASNPRAQTATHESRPDWPTMRIRRTKSGWSHKRARFSVQDKPYAYYDINF